MTTHRAPVDPIGADLLTLLRTLKLGALEDTLPERPRWPGRHTQPHQFLEQLLADEVSRRDARSAAARAARAGLRRRCGWTPGPSRRT